MSADSFDVDRIIATLDLQPHPEGGFYARKYRSRILHCTPSSGATRERSVATSIYYLLPEGHVSRLHRIDADEVWHFYDGDSIVIVEINCDGQERSTLIGRNLSLGQNLQHTVEAGVWFGAYVPRGSRGALVGCTVSPAFEFDTFEIADGKELARRFPTSRITIERLTRLPQDEGNLVKY